MRGMIKAAIDTCMGSMLEVATCIAPYCQYLLGVQSCALRDGFDYQGFVSVFNQGMPARQSATACVDVFDGYYADHDEAGIYTCAALDMSQVQAVNHALNVVVSELLSDLDLIPLIKQARRVSPRFCMWPIYTDLVAFCQRVENQLLDNPEVTAPDNLVPALHHVYSAVDQMVVARCGGSSTEGNAYGFSIYLPPRTIDDSYYVSPFIEHSQWINLLQAIC